ncbi:sodium/proton antiporter NhaB [Candidatus Pantoea edessiphila]|uniref:Na(+)/H(+) antiporter NhaB n=1 Tax=Candidatus Pantoea edessiphila TaxID=2044610 RepID=A0A2P5T0Q2_9GAMM|nr:sodium/proton antiporter NhaB [Candidatus Pantoea edessiphila]PPI88174.1 sodium/proton antiporter NhaB [Candidatus Pantoea edessiphila]
MCISYINILKKNFLGTSPNWYKLLIVIFLIINPILYFFNSFTAGWFLIIEFVFTLSMASKCYPLLPGGLLSLEAIIIGMSNAEKVKIELYHNIEVLLLLIFMVSGIFFIKQLLLFCFTKLILNINSKIKLALIFCLTSSLLSAFIDAITVLAIVITVFISFHDTCKQVLYKDDDKNKLIDNREENLEQFCAFLRSLVMHAGIGTTLGGIITMVAQPQNLIIAHAVNWSFIEFFLRMLPISISVMISGMFMIFIVEKFKLFGYGAVLPNAVHELLNEIYKKSFKQNTDENNIKLIIQGIVVIWLLIALIFQFSEAGLIGLSVIIISASLLGIIDEQNISKAFTDILPFASLLVVFCSIIAVIEDQKLLIPIINFVLHFDFNIQLKLFYIFNGLFSSVADNVFIASVYINEIKNAFKNGNISNSQFELLAIVTNVGTNIPSIATPNGQAAFVFLLTSRLSPLINLSYKRMTWMALPFTIILSLVGYCCINSLLVKYTQYLLKIGWVSSHDF